MSSESKESRSAKNSKYYQKNRASIQVNVTNRRLAKRTAWLEYKKTLCCVKCGQNHPAALDFHHIVYDPNNRKLSALLRNNAYNKILAEVKKCIVLCANCHRVHHFDERHSKTST